MPDDRTKPIPIGSIHREDGAHELASSPEMEPYLSSQWRWCRTPIRRRRWRRFGGCLWKDAMCGGCHTRQNRLDPRSECSSDRPAASER